MSDRNAERNPLKRNTLLLLLSAAVLLAIAAATLLLPGSASAPDELPPAQAVDAGDMVRVEEGILKCVWNRSFSLHLTSIFQTRMMNIFSNSINVTAIRTVSMPT